MSVITWKGLQGRTATGRRFRIEMRAVGFSSGWWWESRGSSGGPFDSPADAKTGAEGLARNHEKKKRTHHIARRRKEHAARRRT